MPCIHSLVQNYWVIFIWWLFQNLCLPCSMFTLANTRNFLATIVMMNCIGFCCNPPTFYMDFITLWNLHYWSLGDFDNNKKKKPTTEMLHYDAEHGLEHGKRKIIHLKKMYCVCATVKSQPIQAIRYILTEF